MVRSTGASTSASYLAAASALPTFPPHLDLSGSADYARDASPRIRSASSDSSSTSSSSASTSFSSSVPSPTSSEIETPTISSFKQAMPTEMTLVSNVYAPAALLAHNAKSELSEADSLSLTHPALMPTNYAIFGAPIMPTCITATATIGAAHLLDVGFLLVVIQLRSKQRPQAVWNARRPLPHESAPS